MHPAAEFEAQVVYKEPPFADGDYLFMIAFQLRGTGRGEYSLKASVLLPQHVVVKFYSCTNTRRIANDTNTCNIKVRRL